MFIDYRHGMMIPNEKSCFLIGPHLEVSFNSGCHGVPLNHPSQTSWSPPRQRGPTVPPVVRVTVPAPCHDAVFGVLEIGWCTGLGGDGGGSPSPFAQRSPKICIRDWRMTLRYGVAHLRWPVLANCGVAEKSRGSIFHPVYESFETKKMDLSKIPVK